MPKLWLTYAWTDNEDADVDHIVAELEASGLQVLLDRRHIIPGQRLWSQIAAGIGDPTVDAWAIYATENSLRSEPCQEELAYALDRALRSRGITFPLIGIFPAPVDDSLVPPAIAVRLYVSLASPEWVSDVRDGVIGKRSESTKGPPTPWKIALHRGADGNLVVEIRPRSGRWRPAGVGVQTHEADALISILPGPSGSPPPMAMVMLPEIGSTVGGQWTWHSFDNPVDPANSLFATFSRPVSLFAFGQPPLRGAKQDIHLCDWAVNFPSSV